MKPLATELGLAPVAGKEYKLFLVEVDDEDRERVLAGRVSRCEISIEPEYAEIRSDYIYGSVARFRESETVTCTLTLRQNPVDGTYFTIEDFSQDEIKEEEDE